MRVGLPRVRVRLWWLLVAVAIVALTLEGWIVWRRYTAYRVRAESLARQAVYLRRMVASNAKNLARGTTLDFEDGRPPVPATPENAERYIARIERMADRYERAARQPWLPVAPDPPPPD